MCIRDSWYTDNQPSAEEAFSKLIPRIHDGAIVLLHSTSLSLIHICMYLPG